MALKEQHLATPSRVSKGVSLADDTTLDDINQTEEENEGDDHDQIST